jgi:protein involved in sex pheromone biosynthesis
MNNFIKLICLCFIVSGCSNKQIEEKDIVEYFKTHKTTSSTYAIVKNSDVSGDNYLGVFFGLSDNFAACAEIIKPYNENPELSVISGTYRCERLN